MENTQDRVVRLADLGTDPHIDDMDRIALCAVALQELAIANALVLVHGAEAGQRRYLEVGGCIRFTPDGHPVIPVAAAARAANL